MSQSYIEGREGLYMLLNQHAHTALGSQPIFEAFGAATNQGMTQFESDPLSNPLPQGLTIQEAANDAGVSQDPESLSSLYRFLEKSSLEQLERTALDFLVTEADTPLVGYLEEAPTNTILIAASLLTRLATAEQDGGRIMLIELTKRGESRVSSSMVSVSREPFTGVGEGATVFVSNEDEFVYGRAGSLGEHLQAAHTAVDEVFGSASAAETLLLRRDEDGVDLEAELEAIRQSVEGIYPAEEVESVLELIRGAFEPVEDTEPEEDRLRRLIAFAVSMAQ